MYKNILGISFIGLNKLNIKHVNLHKNMVSIAIILLPMLYRLDFYFTSLSATFFSFVFFALALLPGILFRENYSWRKNDIFVLLFLCWELIRYFSSPVLDDTFIFFE